MTEHSPKFDMIRGFYARKMWRKTQVADAVAKGWITAEEYEEIVGEPYPA